MKYTTTLLTFTSIIAVSMAFPTVEGVPTPLARRKVAEYKQPWSAVGTCIENGCHYQPDTLPARCKSSNCHGKIGEPCTVAYGDGAKEYLQGYVPNIEAKCPNNELTFDWEWPWIDHAWKDAWDTYHQCIVNAKNNNNKHDRQEALKICDQTINY